MTTTTKRGEFLRVHTPTADVATPVPLGLPATDYWHSFAEATGWAVCQVANASSKKSTIEVRPAVIDGLLDSDAYQSGPVISRNAALELARRSEDLVRRLDAAEKTIRRQEAELASRVSPPLSRGSAEGLAKKLESVLKEGATAARCTAAGLYLLNDETSELKLRARYGIPRNRLEQPARPLRGAMGDLECLVSGLAVIERLTANPQWASPEPWEAGMCAQVSIDGFPIGTLWMWRSRAGKFGIGAQAAIRAAADQIALLLQQSTAKRAKRSAKIANKNLNTGVRWQQQSLPIDQPLAPDWHAAGWVDGQSRLASSWYSWDVLPDGSIGMVLAQGLGRGGIGDAFTGLALRTAWQSHVGYRHSPKSVLQRVADTLWQTSQEVPQGMVTYGRVQPDTGDIELAWFGNHSVLVASRYGYRSVTQPGPNFGSHPDLLAQSTHLRLQPGECLLIACPGLLRDPGTAIPGRVSQQELTGIVREHLVEKVAAIMSAVRRSVAQKQRPSEDRGLILLQRLQMGPS